MNGFVLCSLRARLALTLAVPLCISAVGSAQTSAPKPITLDEYLNTTEITGAQISPDGSAAVVTTSVPDWEHDRHRRNLWLWRRGAGPIAPVTTTGDNANPLWSPSGRWVAFLSDRPLAGMGESESGKDDSKTERVWIMPVAGCDDFQLYREPLDVHAFAWAPKGDEVLFSVMEPRSKNAEEAHKKEWKDTVEWRDKDRGDTLLALTVDAAVRAQQKVPLAHDESKPAADKAAADKAAADKPAYPAEARVVTHSSMAIEDIVASPAGDRIAFETGPVAHRLENPADTELFVVAARAPAAGGSEARQLTHNQGAEGRLAWDTTGKKMYVLVRAAGGSIEGPYQDVQGRLYAIDAATGAPTRLGGKFPGSWEDLTVSHTGEVYAEGLQGMNRLLYRVDGDSFKPISSTTGSYGRLSVADHGGAMLFIHSAISEPAQVYFAADAGKAKTPEPVTAFNPVFKERARPEWQPYQWTSDDGTKVEGVLVYPPGKKGAQHLRMLTLIHGGPADADGDRFGANWYDWAGIAAARGWLVFRPNYRGSTGYGDAFQLGIKPHLVSAPGKDILSGVDALVKQGIADPDHLAIAGYSYGGYMTNWVITQTTRFKAAMTGAGAVEHAANWGFDDLSYDDAWYLSGAPWEKPELYQSEAALFQMNKITTPTHMIGGDADNRVSFFEQIVFERALQRLNVPHALLQFPGENHPLSKNPWHGYVALREELKWLEKYAGK